MAKSKETYNKKEKEKKRLKAKQEKREKMMERKANAGNKSMDDMMAYIDENGNLTSTPPDPRRKIEFDVESIQIGVPRREEDPNAINEGVVSFFNEDKGFGFIMDGNSGERLFFHVNQLQERLKENDKVTYDIEKGDRGYNAANIRKL